jgi:hypothetical protein
MIRDSCKFKSGKELETRHGQDFDASYLPHFRRMYSSTGIGQTTDKTFVVNPSGRVLTSRSNAHRVHGAECGWTVGGVEECKRSHKGDTGGCLESFEGEVEFDLRMTTQRSFNSSSSRLCAERPIVQAREPEACGRTRSNLESVPPPAPFRAPSTCAGQPLRRSAECHCGWPVAKPRPGDPGIYRSEHTRCENIGCLSFPSSEGIEYRIIDVFTVAKSHRSVNIRRVMLTARKSYERALISSGFTSAREAGIREIRIASCFRRKRCCCFLFAGRSRSATTAARWSSSPSTEPSPTSCGPVSGEHPALARAASRGRSREPRSMRPQRSGDPLCVGTRGLLTSSGGRGRHTEKRMAEIPAVDCLVEMLDAWQKAWSEQCARGAGARLADTPEADDPPQITSRTSAGAITTAVGAVALVCRNQLQIPDIATRGRLPRAQIFRSAYRNLADPDRHAGPPATYHELRGPFGWSIDLPGR